MAEYRRIIPTRKRRFHLNPRPEWMKSLPDYQTEIQEWDEDKEQICTGH